MSILIAEVASSHTSQADETINGKIQKKDFLSKQAAIVAKWIGETPLFAAAAGISSGINHMVQNNLATYSDIITDEDAKDIRVNDLGTTAFDSEGLPFFKAEVPGDVLNFGRTSAISGVMSKMKEQEKQSKKRNQGQARRSIDFSKRPNTQSAMSDYSNAVQIRKSLRSSALKRGVSRSKNMLSQSITLDPASRTTHDFNRRSINLASIQKGEDDNRSKTTVERGSRPQSQVVERR